ncbi:SPOR domain-containing protein [Marinobacteraceae bacterium S3BR75-40.1]
MTRDYAKKQSASPKKGGAKAKRQKAPARPAPTQTAGPSTAQWLMIVALTSGFVGFMVYLYSVPPAAPPAVTMPPPSQPAPAKPGSTGKPRGEETRDFRFYEMLPESEVVAPKVEAYQPDNGAGEDYFYMLQTGSFRTAADAERQKAQIGFQGLRAEVKEVNLDSGARWYRVQVGPFISRSKMNSAFDRLVSINIEPMIRKIKQPPDQG